ncbi:MAG: spore germination protein [Ruminococcaceae bacterium]|nr:spore germination protein [Oscillospiraceae bacterium]
MEQNISKGVFILQNRYDELTSALDLRLNPNASFDIVKRELILGGRKSALYFVDGFIKDEVFERIMEFMFRISPEQLKGVETADEFSQRFIPYVEVDTNSDADAVCTAILSGGAVLVVDSVADYLVIDTRTYPMRSISEPEKDKTMRGSKDGFVETLIFNTAMVRRRVRDTSLRMEYYQIGENSKVDVAICFLDGKCDKKALEILRKRLKSVNLKGISMTQQALAEVICPTFFLNPFPKIKYTERPDYASACLLEGRVLLIMDNAPTVMIFPTSFADFTKEANDYYFPPLTASYIRITRQLISVITVILTPLFLLLINNPGYIPDWLSFIKLDQTPVIPIFIQLLILEFVIDGLRIASLNTPDNLSSSMSIIGGLLLSEFAINAGWFEAECILYMAFVAIAGFSQPSFEMGYAQKFIRIFLLLVTEFFGIFGLIGGLVLTVLTMALTKTLTGRNYFYPVIPFNLKDFIRLFIRPDIKE